MSEEERLARLANASTEEFGSRDRIEQKLGDYFERVEEAYTYIRQNLGATGIHAAGGVDDVAERWRPIIFPQATP